MQQYFFSTYFVPGAILDTRDATVNKIGLCFKSISIL